MQRKKNTIIFFYFFLCLQPRKMNPIFNINKQITNAMKASNNQLPKLHYMLNVS